MDRTDETIEAEVIEIDGISVDDIPEKQPLPGQDWRDWRGWTGRVRRLDARWWPLWAILGVLGLVLFVAVGMCVLVILLFYKLFMGVLLGVVRLFVPAGEYQRR